MQNGGRDECGTEAGAKAMREETMRDEMRRCGTRRCGTRCGCGAGGGGGGDTNVGTKPSNGVETILARSRGMRGETISARGRGKGGDDGVVEARVGKQCGVSGEPLKVSWAEVAKRGSREREEWDEFMRR